MKNELRILLLEDDPVDAEILEKELKRGGIGFLIQRVETEAEFLRGLKQFDPDIILADYSLPDFNGMSALKIATTEYRDIPFIFISGTVGEEFAIETMKSGATDYVMKGRLSRLVPAVERAMSEKQKRIELRHADETLRKAEEKFRTLVERMPAMTYLSALDDKFTALYVSPQVEEMMGFSSREFLEQSDLWSRHLHPEDRDKVMVELVRCVNEGMPFKYEYRMIKRNGEIRWFHDENIIIRDRAGNPLYLEGVNFDITDSKQAQQDLKESEEKFRQITSNIDGVFWMNTPELNRMLYVSPQYERIWGRPIGDLYNNPAQWYEFIHPEDRENTYKLFSENIGKPTEVVFRIIRPDSGIRWIRSRSYPLFDENGKLYRTAGVAEDITEMRNTQEEMRKLSAVVDQNPDMVIVFNADGTIEYANEASEKLTGFDIAEIVGTKREDLNIEQFSVTKFEKILDILRSNKSYEDIIKYHKKTGEELYLHMMISLLKDDLGNTTHVIARGQDITEKKQIEEKLNYIANYDILTGLPNRSLFGDRLEQAIARTITSHRFIAVIIITIDRFKMINDSYGILTGDEVLKEVSKRIGSSIRNGDTPTRLGADDFAVVLFDVAHLDDIVLVVNKIQKRIAEPYYYNDTRITVSIGIAIHPADGTTAPELIQNADIANSQAKMDGGNCFRYFTGDMNIKASEFIFMEKHLLNALNDREYTIHYQPYYSTENRQIVGFESLIRLESKELGLVPPIKFISVLEDTGMIIPVGVWIIKTVCESIREWINNGFNAVPVSINLSVNQFKQPNFFNVVKGIIDAAGIDPRYIVFELTESIFAGDVSSSEAIISELKSAGYSISIDDFGTGYSSLSYLKRLKVDNLKIDISFIREVNRDPDSASIVTAVISMAHNLGLKTIAEGVETEEQFNILRILKCDYVQGYYMSKPLPLEDANKLLTGVSYAA